MSFILLVFTLAVLTCCCGFRAVPEIAQRNVSRGGHDQWLHIVTKMALMRFHLNSELQNAGKLAVVVLLTDLHRRDRDRVGELRLSTELSSKHLYPFTPTLVYIFTLESEMDTVRSGLGDWLLPNMVVLPLHSEGWATPAHVGSQHHWHSHDPPTYRLMGDWRLSSMPEFARRMGHRYVMQLDDDSYIISPVGEDLVAKFDREKLLLGAKDMERDPPHVTWGLPELARYFVMTHKVVPATLFEHCKPPDITGLYSAFKIQRLENNVADKDLERLNKLGLPTTGGWNREVLFGNCIMYSLDWWFQPLVNRFVQLCRATGGAFAYRWNEQGVIAMLWQIFVPPEQLHMFQFHYTHRGTEMEVRTKVKQLAEHGELLSSPPTRPPAEE